MTLIQCANSFQFQYQPLFNDNISPIITNTYAMIVYWDLNL